jgi:hypothetical protein
VTFPSISFVLFRGADGQLELPTLDKIEQLANAGLDLPSLDKIMDSPPAGAAIGGWVDIIEQGPPTGNFTDQLITAMESGAIDPSIVGTLGDANYCGIQNMISNLQRPVIEGGFEITHTNPTLGDSTAKWFESNLYLFLYSNIHFYN